MQFCGNDVCSYLKIPITYFVALQSLSEWYKKATIPCILAPILSLCPLSLPSHCKFLNFVNSQSAVPPPNNVIMTKYYIPLKLVSIIPSYTHPCNFVAIKLVNLKYIHRKIVFFFTLFSYYFTLSLHWLAATPCSSGI